MNYCNIREYENKYKKYDQTIVGHAFVLVEWTIIFKCINIIRCFLAVFSQYLKKKIYIYT